MLDISVDNEEYLKIDKFEQIISYDILISYYQLMKFFKTTTPDEDEFKSVYAGETLLFPFKWNFLHIYAISGSDGPCKISNFPNNIKVPINLFFARDFLGNNCFDILMHLKRKELFKSFMELFIKSYNSEETSFYCKAKIFEQEYNPITKKISIHFFANF